MEEYELIKLFVSICTKAEIPGADPQDKENHGKFMDTVLTMLGKWHANQYSLEALDEDDPLQVLFADFVDGIESEGMLDQLKSEVSRVVESQQLTVVNQGVAKPQESVPEASSKVEPGPAVKAAEPKAEPQVVLDEPTRQAKPAKVVKVGQPKDNSRGGFRPPEGFKKYGTIAGFVVVLLIAVVAVIGVVGRDGKPPLPGSAAGATPGVTSGEIGPVVEPTVAQPQAAVVPQGVPTPMVLQPVPEQRDVALSVAGNSGGAQVVGGSQPGIESGSSMSTGGVGTVVGTWKGKSYTYRVCPVAKRNVPGGVCSSSCLSKVGVSGVPGIVVKPQTCLPGG